jgi:adenylate cyclase
VLTFSGDAVMCWFDDSGDGGWSTQGSALPTAVHRAATCALGMQVAMRQFASLDVAGVGVVSLAVKVAVAAGPATRFLVGDPAIQTIDVLAGETLQRLARAEHHAERGDVLLDEPAVEVLGSLVEKVGQSGELKWQTDEETDERFAVLRALTDVVSPDPWTVLEDSAFTEEEIRPWLLPPVAERLFRGAGEFLTELRPAVSMFIRFGGIDYDGDPEADNQLNGFIEAVQEILNHYESYILQLTIGDKGSYLNTSFGAPIAHGDDVVRAVTAALELRDLRWPGVGHLQIGIAQGRLRTGAYGGVTRRTYGVLGDEVNLAARLMMTAAPGEVVVDYAIRKAATDAFLWETMAPLHVKGKSNAIRASRLVGFAARDSLGLRQVEYSLPMVGRERELARIVSILATATRGRGQVVGISGDAGMGKSRLVAEVIREAYGLGMDVFGSACQSYGMDASYLVWQHVIRGVLRVEPRQSDEEQIRDVANTLASINPHLAARTPLLGPVIGLSIDDNDLTASFDSTLRKTSLESLLVDCVRARAIERPVLIVIEDAHWIDPLSSDLLDAIVRASGDVPLSVLVVYRNTERPDLSLLGLRSLRTFTEVPLSELSPDRLADLVQAKLVQLYPEVDSTGQPSAESFARLVEELRLRSQGNPFYVEELLHFFADRGLDPRRLETLDRHDLPDSLFSLILGRIDHLTEDQKTALKVASVIGRIFRVAMLTGVYPPFAESDGLRADLDLLFELDLTLLDAPEPELSYLFKHVLTQEVAYETLSFATRAMLHERIGLYIESTQADAIDTQLDLLAHHYDLSENVAKRCEFILRAAEAAKSAGANLSAINYFRRVLSLVTDHDRIHALLQLAQVQELVGEWTDGDALNREALSIATSLGADARTARAEFALGVLARKRGSYGEAVSWLTSSGDRYAALDDIAALSHTIAELAEVQRLQGHYSDAAALYSQSSDLAATIADDTARKSALAHALKGAGAVAAGRGDYVTAKRCNNASVDLRRELSDKHGVAVLLNNQGIIARFEQDLAAARRFNEESVALFREVGDRWALGQLLNNQACVAADQRNYTEAESLLGESLFIRRQLGDQAGLALSLNTLADVLIDQGRFGEAVLALEESLTINRELGDLTAIAYLVDDFAAVAVFEGRHGDALRLAGFSVGLREQIGAKLPPAEAHRVERLLESARATVDDLESSVHWITGRQLGESLRIEELFSER